MDHHLTSYKSGPMLNQKCTSVLYGQAFLVVAQEGCQ